MTGRRIVTDHTGEPVSDEPCDPPCPPCGNHADCWRDVTS